ncbi:hypothetical protein JKP88DRAFT_260849 [Tribonema minus]|uniref:Uncharacterized protein n=1 Tax=Tribonema minus TaxID=303371 RepID=A0A835ZEH3_9STRA|nr:hypothetical protein JKP88DRAFT_260849 [Tribonema minus]
MMLELPPLLPTLAPPASPACSTPCRSILKQAPASTRQRKRVRFTLPQALPLPPLATDTEHQSKNTSMPSPRAAVGTLPICLSPPDRHHQSWTPEHFACTPAFTVQMPTQHKRKQQHTSVLAPIPRRILAPIISPVRARHAAAATQYASCWNAQDQSPPRRSRLMQTLWTARQTQDIAHVSCHAQLKQAAVRPAERISGCPVA